MTFPKLIAHRGAKKFAPENTLSSFELAKQMGAAWIECDIQLSQDNQLFIFHDDRLERTTDGQGIAIDKTWSELAKLDAGSWFAKQYQNEKIPSLSEALACFKEQNLAANLEIKACNNAAHNIRTAQAFCDFYQANLDLFNFEFVISSFSFEILQCIHQNCPNLPLAMLLYIENWEKEFKLNREAIAKLYQKLNCIALNINQEILTPERMNDLGFAKTIGAYTVNHVKRANILYAMGVNFVFSDSPNLIG